MARIYEFIPPQRNSSVQALEPALSEPHDEHSESQWANRSIKIAVCVCIACLAAWALTLCAVFIGALYKGSYVLFGNGYVGIAGLVLLVMWLLSIGRDHMNAAKRTPVHPLLAAPRKLYLVSSQPEPLRDPPDDCTPAA